MKKTPFVFKELTTDMRRQLCPAINYKRSTSLSVQAKVRRSNYEDKEAFGP